jgi:probable rRNA maturation factor
MEPPSKTSAHKMAPIKTQADEICMQEVSIEKSSFEAFYMDLIKWDALSLKVRSRLSLEDYELSFEFLSPQDMGKLNLEYRNIDKPTDVLSFPQIEFDRPHRLGEVMTDSHFHKVLGDIVICPDVCEQNALAIGHSISREACFLMIHGILHLCGHDHIDPSEEKIMLEQQVALMSLLTEEDWTGLIEVRKI